MKNNKRKAWYKRMWVYILGTLLSVILLFFIIEAILCSIDVNKKIESLKSYEAKIANLEYGAMSYVDKGEGEVLLSIHGIFGGYDQAFETASDYKDDYRIIAPSRFGYLDSDVLNRGTPKDQAYAYKLLLDELNIDKVYLLAASAGGTVAIRFAMDYPDRCKGVIMYSASMPYKDKPTDLPSYAGPPEFACNDFFMFLFKGMMGPLMGMSKDTVYDLFPIEKRKEGVLIDSKITNIDLGGNFDEYDIENINVPFIVFQAKDDKLSDYNQSIEASSRFKNIEYISFENGGHLLSGHKEEINENVKKFINNNI